MDGVLVEFVWLHIMRVIIVVIELWMSTVMVIVTTVRMLVRVIPLSVLLCLNIIWVVAVGREEDWPAISVFVRTDTVGIMNIPVVLVMMSWVSIIVIIF